MISKAILQKHYHEYASQPDGWVNNMEKTKRSIVKTVLKQVPVGTRSSPRVVVLGASDRRYIPIHKRIFSELLGQYVEMITFDLDRQHLGTAGVVKHDVTKPFPNGQYSLIFSHELMKFLTEEEQILTIKNSYDALQAGGVAMHIMHEPSIRGTKELRSWQYRVSPSKLVSTLKSSGILSQIIELESESNVSWLRKTTVIVLKKPIPNVLVAGASSKSSLGYAVGEALKGQGYGVTYASRSGKLGVACNLDNVDAVNKLLKRLNPQIVVHGAGVFLTPLKLGKIKHWESVKSHLGAKAFGALVLANGAAGLEKQPTFIVLGGRETSAHPGFAPYTIGNGSIWALVRYLAQHSGIKAYFLDLPFVNNSTMHLKYAQFAGKMPRGIDTNEVTKTVERLMKGKYKNGSRIILGEKGGA